ncbi:MAG: 23S rRNA (cytidine(2498)-2'-O)-methyltransferase RlmM, partial [Candidatus Competibacterales bacterium]
VAPFCRKFPHPGVQALTRQGRLPADDPALPRLHLCFIAPTMAFPALGFVGRSSPWPMGIPRLKQHPQAPSRSALKLEEALLTFLTFDERRRRLLPGQRAVDLGAAPGGWTWQLVRRHLFVTAVDNGALDPRLMDSGLVEHLRCDGFRYRPPRPVDWMVCDMVEKPLQVATLAAHWLAKGDCRETIFNLKLPMKRRYATLVACRAKIPQVLGHTPHTLRIKQLYHDREEVTAHLANPSAIA